MIKESGYVDYISTKYIDCVDYITNKVDLDCLIDKNVFQWHNFILYILIASYVIITLYPIYKGILEKKGLVNKFLFNPINICHTMISISILMILYLDYKFSIFAIIGIILLTTISEYFIDKYFIKSEK